MDNINFQPVFEYMDEKFDEVKQDIAEVKQDVRQLKISVDGIVKIVKNHSEEIVVINHRLDKLEAKVG